MINVKLIGSPVCRRYQKLRADVILEAQRLGISVQIEEIGDTENLSQYNPLSLPRLYIQGDLIAAKNPPKPKDVARALQNEQLKTTQDAQNKLAL